MITLSQVRSLAYVIVPLQPAPQALDAIRSSPLDLVILGNVHPLPAGLITRQGEADPLNHKIVLGYVDVGESTPITTRHYLDVQNLGQLPSWFGQANPGWLNPDPVDNLYTVQFWHPAWREVLKEQIEAQISAGFDGIFLDVLSAYRQWAPGNPYGNPVQPDAMAQMAQLVGDIRAFVTSLELDRPFYLVGNGADSFAATQPQVLDALDAVFNENMLWHHDPGNGKTSVPEAYPAPLLSHLSTAFAGQLVFANDYPPLSSEEQLLASFKTATARYWVPTVNQPFQTDGILATGPFMFLASEAAPTVTGSATHTNFMAGGRAPTASLTGGAQRDFFIGGMGQTTVSAGGGNDVVFAHPEAAYQLGQLVLLLSGNVVRGEGPVVNVWVNGQLQAAGVHVTASRAAGQTQAIELEVRGLQVNDIRIQHTNDQFFSPAEDRNLYVHQLTLNGTDIPLPTGTYTRDYGLPNIAGQMDMAWGGELRFGAAALEEASLSTATPGGTMVNGGAGLDTVVYEGRASHYQHTTSGSDWWVTLRSGPMAPDRLTQVERILFDDRPEGSAAARLAAVATGENIDAGSGLDSLLYTGLRGQYELAHTASGFTVRHGSAIDTLLNIERLHFRDQSVALDLNEQAGVVARTLGAVFGPLAVGNKAYAGMGLQLLDEGLSDIGLMDLALNAALGPQRSNTSVVQLLYQNVVGQAPTPEVAAQYVDLIDRGDFSQGSLGLFAAYTELNEARIQLVGLTLSGLAYTPAL